MSGWFSYCFAIKVRGNWKSQYRFGGYTYAEAEAKAIERLQHSYNGQVSMIRRADTHEVIWDRTQKPPLVSMVVKDVA